MLVASRNKFEMHQQSNQTSSAGLARLSWKKNLFATTIIAGFFVHCSAAMADDEAPKVVKLPIGENTETTSAIDAPLRGSGFSITIDGETVAGDIPANISKAKSQRKTDIALEAVDIQVKFDGLDVQPVLNVSTVDARRAYQAGSRIEFIATSNYPAWIKRSEILIYERGTIGQGKPIDSIAVDATGRGAWSMPSDGNDGEYEYVLRVYDHRDRFDETLPLSLTRTTSNFERHATANTDLPISAGNGEDRTAKRNIPVYGGAVTIYGRYVPYGHRVVALGEEIPVDNQDSFVVQRILPPGDHNVDVAVEGGKDGGVNFDRSINIPSNDLFYVGLVDLTIGKRFGDDAVEAADPGEYDDVYTRGRLAFYLKGKIKGRYLITASADTGEDKIENLFRGLDSKNPRQVLRRIDPNKYYPVYGDDSTSVQDAQTSGKFFVKIERNDSHIMWGDFKSSVNGNRYLRSERALYGAQARYRSEAATSFGERKIELEAYAAQPDTLPQRDILRGTGGSAYFLKRQDISIASETLSVEMRDPLTGNVIETVQLIEGEDYTIDYIQGVVILSRPLSSTATGVGLVREGALGDYVINLVAQYEYTPTAGDVDGYSYGGRAQAWLGEHVRLGVTGMVEETGNDDAGINADQEMIGVDAKIRHSETTFIEGHYAQTKGSGFGTTFSNDGGLTSEDQTSAGISNRVASAWRVAGQLDLADISNGDLTGRIGAYYEEKEAGFATLDSNITVDQRIWGAHAQFDINEKLILGVAYDNYSDDNDVERIELTADAAWQIDDYWKLTLGAKYSDLRDPSGDVESNGKRTDLAAKITFSPDDGREYYAFAQGTVDRSGGRDRNDRGGVGAKIKLTEKIGLEGEVSYGTTGWGALAGLTYDPTADEHYYLGYRLDGAREVGSSTLSGRDNGQVVFGARRRYDDQWSAFTENNYDMFGKRRALTSTYGVTYTPDAKWTVDGGLEIGRVDGSTDEDVDRKAISVGVSYKDGDGFTARARGEVRLDNSDAGDVESFLFTGGVAYKVDPNWRLVASVDGLISNTDKVDGTEDILDGDYVEASVGFAYRPVENDRLNALFKYTLLYDLPGSDQVTADGTTYAPRQRSHVLSADATYRLNNYLTIGGKYGFRIGEVETERGSGDYTSSSAHLGIVRADLHVVHNWDVLLEGRVLYSPSADTVDYGALAAVYRHFGNNLKAGVGYNFGSFSDDLTDLTQDDQGVFFNVIGKF